MPDPKRAESLRSLFRRSASRRLVRPNPNVSESDALLERSMFFSQVGHGDYRVECRLGSGQDPSALSMFAFGEPNSDGLIPNLLIQFASNGAVVALVEQMVEPTSNPDLFRPVQAIPRAPNSGDRFEEVIAEKVADHVIDDLLERSVELGGRANEKSR